MKKSGQQIAISIFAGFFSGFLFSLFFFMLAFTAHNIVAFRGFEAFIDSLSTAIDRNVAFLIMFSSLFAILAFVSNASLFSLKRKSLMANTVAFIITATAVFIWYTGILTDIEVLLIQYQVFVIFLIVNLLIAIVFFSFIKRAFYSLYLFVLRVFMVENYTHYIYGEKEVIKKPQSETFLLQLEAMLGVNKRHKGSIGIIGVKIANTAEILQRYGSKGYSLIEKQLITLVTKNARVGENQCLEQKGAFFSLLYADEDGAHGAARRYDSFLSAYTFLYNNKPAKVDIALSVAGINFEKFTEERSIADLRDIIILKSIDTLTEAAESGRYCVRY